MIHWFFRWFFDWAASKNPKSFQLIATREGAKIWLLKGEFRYLLNRGGRAVALAVPGNVLLYSKAAVCEEVLVHELTHIRQFARMNSFQIILNTLKEKRLSYHRRPSEKEAFANQKAFRRAEWLRIRAARQLRKSYQSQLYR